MIYIDDAAELAAFSGTELSLSTDIVDLDPLFALEGLVDLDLSTDAAQLPDRFGSLRGLERLRLRGDQLTVVPPSVFEITSLEALELSGDAFGALPDAVAELGALRDLKVRTDNTAFAWPSNLAELQLTALTVHGLPVPPDAWRLALEELHLVRNGREGLYEEIAGLERLRVLHMQYNPTAELPAWLFNLTELRELDFGFIGLEHCPPEIAKLKELRHLGLYMGKLKALPHEIGELSELRVLTLTSNEITALPASLARCSKLESLELYSNAIEEIPAALFPHPTLRRIDLTSCAELLALPDTLGASPALEDLNLTFAGEVESLAPLEGSPLKKLNIEYCAARDLDAIGTLTRLEELTVGRRHRLEDISWLARCVNLRTLDIGGCSSMKKPERALGALSNLEVLDAHETTVKDTAPLATLARLRELNLSESKVTQAALAASTSIAKLDLSQCRLKSLEGLPVSVEDLAIGGRKLSCPLDPLGALTHLKRLDLADAKLEDASALAALTTLEELDLSGNKLDDISFLAAMTELRVLDLSRNTKLADLSVLAGMPHLRSLALYGLRKVKDTSMIAAGCDVDGP